MPGLDLVPSRLNNVVLDGYLMVHRKSLDFLFNNISKHIFKRYNMIIFDCPPNLHLATCSAILSSDLVITPLNPDIYSYDGLKVMDKELHNIS
ncbi:ParA family protein [Rickettsiella massiliensis]|uniref:ParA family protein n=1 Tax=Rickettsiella massiliensis TaxID=676517 RepID=UPI00029A4C4B